IDPARQRDDTILDGYTDFVDLHTRIPPQFIQNVLLDIFISTDANRHGACLLSLLYCFDAYSLPRLRSDSLLTTVIDSIPVTSANLTQQSAIAGSERERVSTVYLAFTGLSFGTEYTLLY